MAIYSSEVRVYFGRLLCAFKWLLVKSDYSAEFFIFDIIIACEQFLFDLLQETALFITNYLIAIINAGD